MDEMNASLIRTKTKFLGFEWKVYLLRARGMLLPFLRCHEAHLCDLAGTNDKDVPLAAALVEMKQRQMGGTSTSSLQWHVLPPNATTAPAAVVILAASIPFF